MGQDQKQEEIIRAATKRFAHFGVTKTTMSEIASDLAISKASLYYYFPDKLALYTAVFKAITTEQSELHDAALDKLHDPYEAIQYFLKKRMEFILSYQNILEFLKTAAKIPAEIQPIFNELRLGELRRLNTILRRGEEHGIFHQDRTAETAELFFDFLDGFRRTFFINSNMIFPDKKQLQYALKREIEFSIIFFNGLTVKKE